MESLWKRLGKQQSRRKSRNHAKQPKQEQEMATMSCLWCWWPVYAVLIAGAAALVIFMLYYIVRVWWRSRRGKNERKRAVMYGMKGTVSCLKREKSLGHYV